MHSQLFSKYLPITVETVKFVSDADRVCVCIYKENQLFVQIVNNRLLWEQVNPSTSKVIPSGHKQEKPLELTELKTHK